MKLKKLDSDRLVSINLLKYKINWTGKSRSNFQREVKSFLYKSWAHHIVCEEFPMVGTLNKFDIVDFTLKVIIECDGLQHDNYNPFFHQKSKIKYLNQIKRDVVKERWAEQNGFKVIHIYEKDLPLTKAFFKNEFDIVL
jgi:hypothetical protein